MQPGQKIIDLTISIGTAAVVDWIDYPSGCSFGTLLYHRNAGRLSDIGYITLLKFCSLTGHVICQQIVPESFTRSPNFEGLPLWTSPYEYLKIE